MKKYWVVGSKTVDLKFTVHHSTKEDAISAAIRMASLTLKTVAVFELVGTYTPTVHVEEDDQVDE